MAKESGNQVVSRKNSVNFHHFISGIASIFTIGLGSNVYSDFPKRTLEDDMQHDRAVLLNDFQNAFSQFKVEMQ